VIGDASDFASRLRAMLPDRWFADASPILDALLKGLGTTWASSYAQLQGVSQQSRIATVSGSFLDMAALDYCGALFLRHKNENDDAFRHRIQSFIFRRKVTREALIAAVGDLTGHFPVVFEFTQPSDTGGYGAGCGYGLAGGYGSLVLPYQCLVVAKRPSGAGIPKVAGYNAPAGGYGLGLIEYGTLADELPHVTDQEIYNLISETIPAGTAAWVRLTGASIGGYADLGSFFLDSNSLAP
jgi:hypothetical protein